MLGVFTVKTSAIVLYPQLITREKYESTRYNFTKQHSKLTTIR